MTRLSVNVNKVAVLRNSRGGALPDPVRAARAAIAAGCHGITVHPRPDQRHISCADALHIGAAIGDVEYNIEGNPFAVARGTYPGLIELVRSVHPAQVTLVPDDDGQITSDHGFRIDSEAAARLQRVVAVFRNLGCRVSLFMDAGSQDVERVADIGAQRIEIYTGPYAAAHAHGDFSAELAACAQTAQRAFAAGLGVNAGHDLDQSNLGSLLAAIPDIAEVSIGHALFGEAIYAGLATTVQRYLAICAAATS